MWRWIAGGGVAWIVLGVLVALWIAGAIRKAKEREGR